MSENYSPSVQSYIEIISTSPEGIRKDQCGTVISDGTTGTLYIKRTPKGIATGWKEIATEDDVSFERSFMPETLAQLRAIESNPLNLSATLLGYEAKFDGLLQGEYIWQNDATDADDGATRIRPNDYISSGVWYKFT